MRILLLTSVHNGLSQRALLDLTERGHDVSVALAPDEMAIAERVPAHDPDLVVCPMLTTRIPADVWRRYRCLIVHPGIPGDRGPSSLDWAIQEREPVWGVTILEAAEGFDQGDIWASETFRLRAARKSSVYRREVSDAALRAVHRAVDRVAGGTFRPVPLEEWTEEPLGRLRPPMRQIDRTIDWYEDPTELALAKLHAADGRPGVSDVIRGREVRLYGAHQEGELRGQPSELLARRDGAICRATVDGALWITHMRGTDGEEPSLKLPAAIVLGDAAADLPEVPAPLHARGKVETWREIRYEEDGPVGVLAFDCYNGALGMAQALRLRRAIRYALGRPTRVLVLVGGEDFFCNGIHLALVEEAGAPAEESWRNLLAMNEVVRELVTATEKVTIAALRGDAAAGGLMLALGADEVHARSGVVLNPHYQAMGLFGSEYWTYLLPRRVGVDQALELATACEPVSTETAVRIGLLDDASHEDAKEFETAARERAFQIAGGSDYEERLDRKADRRERDEAARPLLSYAAAELARMHDCFFPPEAHYHLARRMFFAGDLPPARPAEGPYAVDPSLLYTEPGGVEATLEFSLA
jgi:putative two-component system hydrogenase maturation factor HypX/HoxX